MPRVHGYWFGGMLLGWLLVATVQGQTVWYVDGDAPPGGDGTAWATAFNGLQDALDVAGAGDDIRVAQGTYKPDPTGLADPREAAFQLVSGVGLYGGYAGSEAPDPDRRDPVRYLTVLSADLDGNDGPDLSSNGENSYHVLIGNGANGSAVLDGFTVTGGNANGSSELARGGGIYLDAGSPTIANCAFTANVANGGGAIYCCYASSPTIAGCTLLNNHAVFNGGGLANFYGSCPQVTNCTFSRNSAYYGGAIYCYESSPTITDCVIADTTGIRGGGMYCRNNSNPVLTNCTFTRNTATGSNGWGGAILTRDNNLTLIGCTFVCNIAGVYGGAIYHRSGGNAQITNCLFAGNKATGNGGALYSDDSSLTVANSTLTDNAGSNGLALACDTPTAPGTLPSTVEMRNCILWNGGNEVWNNDASSITISYSDVEGGWAGPGTDNLNTDPFFVAGLLGCYYLSHTAAGQAADSPCIDAGDDTAANLGLDTRTTRNDEGFDESIVDLGYHYPVTGLVYLPGDSDADGDVDLLDFSRFQLCFTDSGPTQLDCECCLFDFEPDADVDLADYGVLHGGLSGP